MRGVITCSGIIVVITLIVMIHASITGNNIRRDEVNRSLDGAMDFAFDRMGDVYADKYFTTYDAGKRQQILTDLMEEFCVVLSERVASDGNVTVKLIDSDLDRGLFQIGVTEEYEYPFGGRTGKCYYEKTYSFNSQMFSYIIEYSAVPEKERTSMIRRLLWNFRFYTGLNHYIIL